MRTPSAPLNPPPSNPRRRSTLSSSAGGGISKPTSANTATASTAVANAVRRRMTSNGKTPSIMSKPGSAVSLRSDWGGTQQSLQPGQSAASVTGSVAGEFESRDNVETGSVVSLNSRAIFETQQIMPAPGQTYFQLVIENTGNVLLRDWPRQRMSQKWTRNGNLNPGCIKISVSEFLNGELKEKLVWIFGEKTYDEAINAAVKYVQEESERLRT
ncbi:hypothetical protein HDU97_000492 [Phlyctochytrium planicorne]|nr:hypothetical protein HDU97_000492 [Phlyctochytrium planicorne]